MALRDDLLKTLAGWRLRAPVTDETPLVTSGLLDSVALFNLLLWVEEQTGQPLDPTRIDIREELNTITSVLNLVARLQQEAAGR